ncbi:hypothetical protein [Stenotrophomonas sp.]|uniref:hypothetical protein n=1 Tax=Stenotrophomonas sp. TaxID=69392 RepID=UPI0028A2382B|nr:hypothetical protein [Stenotrophomonas sp.]
MAEREITGFIVRATTEPEEDGAAFYEPAFRIRKLDATYEHPHVSYATSQNIESRTKAEALAIAEAELEQITYVVWSGDGWDVEM